MPSVVAGISEDRRNGDRGAEDVDVWVLWRAARVWRSPRPRRTAGCFTGELDTESLCEHPRECRSHSPRAWKPAQTFASDAQGSGGCTLAARRRRARAESVRR